MDLEDLTEQPDCLLGLAGVQGDDPEVELLDHRLEPEALLDRKALLVVPARDLPWFTAGKDFREMVASKRRRVRAGR